MYKYVVSPPEKAVGRPAQGDAALRCAPSELRETMLIRLIGFIGLIGFKTRMPFCVLLCCFYICFKHMYLVGFTSKGQKSGPTVNHTFR